MAAFAAASWLPRARRPRSQRHPQRFFRPQINTDWHRLRAKALSESQGNHRNRLTSVYQPERVNQGTSPCDSASVYQPESVNKGASPCDPLGSHWTYTGGTLDSHWRNLGVIPISIKDRFPNRQESPSLQHLHWDETAIRILIAA